MSTLAAAAVSVALALASPPATASLDELIARYLDAQGGAARLRALRSLRESGTVTMRMGGETMEGTYLIEMERPNRSRVEMTFGDTRMAEMFDGRSGWSLDDESGTLKRMPEEETREQEVAAEFDDWLLDYRKRGVTVEDLGAAQLGPTATRKLKLTYKGQSEHLYIDARTYLEVRRDELDQRGSPRDTTLSLLYTTVNGVTFPEVVEVTYLDAPSSMMLRTLKAEFDVDIPDSRFAGPK